MSENQVDWTELPENEQPSNEQWEEVSGPELKRELYR